MIISKLSRNSVTTVWLLIVVMSAVYIKYNINVVSDMQQFMPADSSDNRLKVLLHETRKGTAANLIMMQIGGADSVYLADLSRRLKFSLKQNQNLFISVMNGEQNLETDSFRSLMKFRYILKPAEDFSADGLHENFKDFLRALRSGAPEKTINYLLVDPQRSLLKYLSSQSPETKPETFDGVWFVGDNSKALLLAQLNSTGFNLDKQQAGINVIKSEIAKLDNTGKVKLDLSGPGTIAVATRDAIRKTTQQVSWILTGLVLVLFWFGYRSIRLAFIAGIPLITSIIISITITQVIFGELHGIVLAFGITLLGVCLDYPLHLFSHLRKDENSITTLKRILPTLQLGVLTSALAFIAMMGTGFAGLTQLAVFSATGLIVALAVTRWLLPVWISVDWIKRSKVPVSQPFLLKSKISISLVVTGIPLIILLLQDNIWSNDVNQISPVPLKISKIDNELRKKLHAVDINHVFLVEGDTIDQILVRTKNIKSLLMPLVKNGLIGGIQDATDILPDDLSQKQYQSLLPDKITLQKNVSAALSGMEIKKDVFDDFINAVELSKTLQTVKYEDISNSPLELKLRSMLFKQNDRWYSFIRVAGVNDENAFKAWIKESSEIRPYYISMHDSMNVLMNNYLKIAWERLLMVLGLIILVVFWLTKKRKAAIWLMIPVIAGVLISLAVQALLGNLINIFHILSLLLVIGMGFDYSLFFNSAWDNEDQLNERTHAIIISAITTIIAFGTLAFSDIPVLSAMGQTVSVGILTCFIVAQRIAVPEAKEVKHC